jgi:hypothetical protein
MRRDSEGPFREVCSYGGTRELGKTLVATIQARILMDEEPYDDEVVVS